MNQEILSQLFTVAPVTAVLGYWVISLRKENTELKTDVKSAIKDYKEMSANMIKIITLVDHNLQKQEKDNDLVKDIHRMVHEITEIIKKNNLEL